MKRRILLSCVVGASILLSACGGATGTTTTTTEMNNNSNVYETKNEKAVMQSAERVALTDVTLLPGSSWLNEGEDECLKTYFSFENKSEKDISLNLECTADGNSCVFASVDDTLFKPVIAPGETTAGSYYFEIPKSAQNIEIHYSAFEAGSDKVIEENVFRVQ